jgi:hypothetical protein
VGSAGWVNLKRRAEQLRAFEKAQREHGYEDGYALKVAQSRELIYQRAWRSGRDARQAFDRGGDAA